MAKYQTVKLIILAIVSISLSYQLLSEIIHQNGKPNFMQINKTYHINQSVDHNTSEIFHNTTSNFTYYIFQIGFHKVGTRSIQQLFARNNIPSAHWRLIKIKYKHKDTAKMKCGYIEACFNLQHRQNKPLLGAYAKYVQYYGDFGQFVGPQNSMPWYMLLDKQYKSKFIVNIRNINHWLKSRYFHFITNLHADNHTAVIMQWKNEWYRYICNALKYFNDYNPHKLIVFDIENDSIQILVNYFADIFVGKRIFISHNVGKTKHGKKTKRLEQQWHNLTIELPWLLLNDNQDGFSNEYQRIVSRCIDIYNYTNINYNIFKPTN